MIRWFSGSGFDATEAVESANTPTELYEKLGLKYHGREKVERIMDKWRNR